MLPVLMVLKDKLDWRKKLENAATGGVVEKNIIKNFAKFTGKHCKSPTLLKRDSGMDVYLRILRNF